MIDPELKTLAKRIVDTNEPTVLGQPKYKQLANHISKMIEEGHWKPGDQLPSEADMVKAVPASLGTIQKALNKLADQGAIVREHYKGTYVNGPRSLLGPWHLRFIDDKSKMLLPIRQEVLGIEKVLGEEPWHSFLGNSSYFINVKRLIDVNGEFNALSHFFVSGDSFGNLLKMPVTALDGMYIREILRTRFGTPNLRLVEEVKCEPLTDEACKILQLSHGAIGMIFHIRSYGYRDHPVSYHLVYVPPNPRRLELRENVS